MLRAAGGSLCNIMASQSPESDQSNPVTAEQEYRDRLHRAAVMLDSKDTAPWNRIRAMARKYHCDLPPDPWEALRDDDPLDRTGNPAVQSLLQSMSRQRREGAKTWEFSAHG
eukprot:3720235-Rhodomonas_salina.1